VSAIDRLPVLVDLASAPGRTMVFTRTKHRAKQLTKQLVAAGVPAVEMHGNLAQNVRVRNLAAFSDGSATTLVATDIAARGIHVDDVGLVVHADPPIEHKAYLHRSGRTARAGNSGTVITLMTDDQVSAVRDLTRKAGIRPTTTRVGPDSALLTTLAPGERTYVAPSPEAVRTAAAAPSNRGGGRAPSRRADASPGSRARGAGGGGGAGRPANAGAGAGAGRPAGRPAGHGRPAPTSSGAGTPRPAGGGAGSGGGRRRGGPRPR